MKAGSSGRRAVPVRGRIAGLVLAAGLLSLPGAAAGQGAGAAPAPENPLAHELVRGIPEGKRIALYPLWGEFAGPGEPQDIPETDARPLYHRILEAIYRASGGRHEVFGRDRREDLWADCQRERGDCDYEKFWESRSVDVVVRCTGQLHDRGVVLTCTAASPGERKGDVIASAVFPVSRTLFRVEYALNSLGRRLAEGLFAHIGEDRPERIEDAYITDRGAAQRTELTGFLERRLRDGVNRRVEARRRRLEREARERELLRSETERPARSSGYVPALRGEVRRLDESTMMIDVWLTGDGGGDLPTVSQEIRLEWLPPEMAGKLPGTRYRAEARAETSGRLDEKGAERAMRNLARARVVAQALGVPAPSIDVIRSEADGVTALTGTLDHGIPVDESLGGPWSDGPGQLRIELTARVVEVGAGGRPEVRAKLRKNDLRAGEPIWIELYSQEAVHAAVFGWGADNRVVRLYPRPGAPDPALEAGGRLVLPRAGEGRLASAPMPGNSEDHEAIIVLAAGERLALGGLAALVGGTVAGTIEAGVSGAEFFAALGKLDTSRLALIVLPYRVAR